MEISESLNSLISLLSIKVENWVEKWPLLTGVEPKLLNSLFSAVAPQCYACPNIILTSAQLHTDWFYAFLSHELKISKRSTKIDKIDKNERQSRKIDTNWHKLTNIDKNLNGSVEIS